MAVSMSMFSFVQNGKFIALAGSLLSIGLIKRYCNGPAFTEKVNLQGKYVIVTGANTGIGKICSWEMAKRGAFVVMACRDEKKGREALKEVKEKSGSNNTELMILDLADLSSVRRFSEEYHKRYERLDILLNNAGVMACPQWKTKDGFEMQLGTNHLGHFLLTNLLLDLLKKSHPSRIVNVSSTSHYRGDIHFDDLMLEKKYAPTLAYSQSKLANVLFSNELNRRLQGTGVTSNSLHPGVIPTDLARHLFDSTMMKMAAFALSPLFLLITKTQWYGAQTSLYCCLSSDLNDVGGKYFSDCQEKRPNERALDEGVAKKFWELSERLVGL